MRSMYVLRATRRDTIAVKHCRYRTLSLGAYVYKTYRKIGGSRRKGFYGLQNRLRVRVGCQSRPYDECTVAYATSYQLRDGTRPKNSTEG